MCYRSNISGADSGLMEEKMSVNLIFKIAAVGILVSVLGQVLNQSGRTFDCAVLDCSIHI